MRHAAGATSAVTIAVLFLFGCATCPPPPALTQQDLEPGAQLEPRVQLEPGDELSIDFLYWYSGRQL